MNTIDQYKNFGDWGQERGYGTMQALARILQGISGLKQQGEAADENTRWKQSLVNYGIKNNLLNESNAPDMTPRAGDYENITLGADQKYGKKGKFAPVTSSNKNDMLKTRFNEMTSPNIEKLLSMTSPHAGKGGGTGNPALDAAQMIEQEKRDFARNSTDQYTDPESFKRQLMDYDNQIKYYLRQAGVSTYGQAPAPKSADDAAKLLKP
jgi:hypothetical protein